MIAHMLGDRAACPRARWLFLEVELLDLAVFIRSANVGQLGLVHQLCVFRHVAIADKPQHGPDHAGRAEDDRRSSAIHRRHDEHEIGGAIAAPKRLAL